MNALKFLRTGRVGPFSGFAWPEPGTWVEAGDGLDGCRRGVHACREHDLPLWIDAELWRVELAGHVEVAPDKLVARHGRLTERVPAWTSRLCADFATTSILRAGDALASVLREAGRDRAAAEVGSAVDVPALAGLVDGMTRDVDSGVRIAAGYLVDALVHARHPAPHSAAAATAYVARQAVAHAEAYAAGLQPGTPEARGRMATVISDETARQGSWLARRLGVPPPGDAPA